MEREDIKVLPLAIVGLAVAVVDVCIVQEVKRFRELHGDLLRGIGHSILPMPDQEQIDALIEDSFKVFDKDN
jgi:hypothetical protein